MPLNATSWTALGQSLSAPSDLVTALRAQPWAQPFGDALAVQLNALSLPAPSLAGAVPTVTDSGLTLCWLATAPPGPDGEASGVLLSMGGDDAGSVTLSLTLSNVSLELPAVVRFLTASMGETSNLLLDTLAAAASDTLFTANIDVVQSALADSSATCGIQLNAWPAGADLVVPVLPGVDAVSFLLGRISAVIEAEGAAAVMATAGVAIGAEQVWLDIVLPVRDATQPLSLTLDTPITLGNGLADLADFAGKLFGSGAIDPQAQFIPGLDILADLELSAFSISMSTTRELVALSFDVQTYRDWQPCAGLVLEGVGVSFMLMDGQSDIRVFGTAVLGSEDDPVVLDASVTIPLSGGGDWSVELSGELGDDQPVTALLTSSALGGGGGSVHGALGDNVATINGVRVNTLELTVDGTQKTLSSFSLDILVLGQAELFGAVLADPRFTLNCGAGLALESASLEATLVLGNGESGGPLCFQVDGDYQSGVWTFSTALAGPPLPINRLWTASGRAADELPDVLATAEIDALALSYRTGADWSLDVHMAASDSEGATRLDLSVGPGRAAVSGAIAFDAGVLTVGGMLAPLLGGDAPLPDALSAMSVRLIAVSYKGADADTKAATPASAALDLVLAGTSGDTEVAGVVSGRRQDGGWATTVALSALLDADLGHIPVVGSALPAGSLSLDEVMVLYCSAATTAFQFGDLAGALASAVGATALRVPALPDESLDAGLALYVTTTAGGQSRSVLIAAGSGAKEEAGKDGRLQPAQVAQPDQPAPSVPQGQPGGGTPAPGSAPTPAPIPPGGSPDGAFRWVPVKTVIGPVALAQIGFAYQDGSLLVAIDASAEVGGLTVSLTDFGAAFPVDFSSAPSLFLRGLGVDVQNGPVTIAGGIYEATLPADSPLKAAYDGELVLQTSKLGLSALGSYCEPKQGAPSFFVFATADATIGGPPFFFVTGLAAGFGVNRSLILPAVDAVADFPLVSAASQPKPDAATVFAAMDGYLPTADGQDWLAVGVNFTSFQLVRSTAVATASFGTRFQLALLGVSTLTLPPAAAKPTVFAQLGLEAVFAPDDGVLSVQAQLSPASYLFDPSCHLTGGFAFGLWLDPSPYAGDFVVTLGGYHPDYAVPDHFPTVPRLGVNWVLPDAPLTIQGGLYAALLPHCLMTGGALKATWQSGSVKAWFDVQADFLIQWKPYHYDASFGVTFGVEATIDLLLTTVTVNLSVGAWLRLYGPPFAGTATVDLGVTSFTVAFGDAVTPPPLSWSDFKTAFLPTSAVITPRVATGLLRTVTDAAVDCVLRPDATLSIGLLVPAGSVAVNGADIDPATVPGWTRTFGVAPMALTSAEGAVAINLERENAPCADITVTPQPGKGARALWGAGTATGPNDPPQIDGLVLGLSLVPAVPQPARPLPVAIGDLRNDVVSTLSCAWGAAAQTPGGTADASAIIADLVANGFSVGAARAA